MRLPAEWEPHRATWLAWPHNGDTWPGVLAEIPEIWARMIRVLRRHEPLRVLVGDGSTAREIRAAFDLGDGEELEFLVVRTNDAWIRDYGPLFLDEGVVVTTFDSWGGKYPPWDDDDAAGSWIAEHAGVAVRKTDLVLEAGAIDVNGQGSLLTTGSCVLDSVRNPNIDRPTIEAFFSSELGAGNIIWLESGLTGDDTDGHVDNLARFVDAHTVVAPLGTDGDDPDSGLLRANIELLGSACDQDGKPLRVVELPVPDPVRHGKLRCPASYANFYVGNGSVLVPTYRCAQDRLALEILADLFDDREVFGIDCTNVVLGLGGLHCVTLQEPWQAPGGPDRP